MDVHIIVPLEEARSMIRQGYDLSDTNVREAFEWLRALGFTAEALEGLLDAALEAGDRERVSVCRRAMAGSVAAATQCWRLLDARGAC
jgi:hypothetical protein